MERRNRWYKSSLKLGDCTVLEGGREAPYLLVKVAHDPRAVLLRGEKNDVDHFYGGQLVVDDMLFACTKPYEASGTGEQGRYSMLKGSNCSKPTDMCTVQCVAARPHFQTFAVNAVREPTKYPLKRKRAKCTDISDVYRFNMAAFTVRTRAASLSSPSEASRSRIYHIAHRL
jgi:hypothetical protein